MAVSPADPLFGGKILSASALAGVASIDHRGVRHVFVPPDPAVYALDVERIDAVLEPELVSALHEISPDVPPLLTWTRVEVIAKLTGVPAHLVLRAQGRGSGDACDIRHVPHATHWITVGRWR